LSADRTIKNKSVLTASRIWCSDEDWNEGLFETKVKIPNGSEFIPVISLKSKRNKYGYPRIYLFKILNRLPLVIKSGILIRSGEYYGFNGALHDNLITDDFNLFSLEWRHNYICWRVNDHIYWNQTFDQLEPKENFSIIEQMSKDKFYFSLELYPNYSVHQSLEEYSRIPSYFYIDYIKAYHWEDSKTNNSLGRNSTYEGIIFPLVFSGSVVLIILIAVVVIYMRRKIHRQSMNNSNQNNVTNSGYYDDINVYETIELNDHEVPERYVEVKQNRDNKVFAATNNDVECETFINPADKNMTKQRLN